MTISVIIPTHRRVKQVEYLIRSLRDQIFPKEKLQVLLISNLKDHSLRKKSGQWKKEFYDFKYMETGEKGVNKARNLGIRFAGGDILYFLDDDCILPSEDHLTQLVARHQKLTGVAGIGGGYKTADMLKGISQFYYEQQEHWMSAVSGDSCKTSQLIGGNASYKREVFDKGFSFDSRIVFGGSEQSFNHLLVSNGYSLMLFRELDVYHDVRINVLSLIQKSFQQGMGHFKNQLKGKNHEIDMKKEAAFSALPTRSWIHSIYHIFFKLGYFWAGSSGRAEGFVIFRVFFFLFLVLKSRWVIIKNHLLKGIVWKYTTRFLGGIWFYLGALYGVLYVYAIRFLGLMRFYLGTLYGYMIRFLGPLWFGIGILYGYVIRVLGFVWYYLGALYGVLKVSAIRFLGLTRFSIGTLYGYMVQVLGPLWFYVGVLYGYIVRFLGFVWFYLGALYGILHVSTIRFSGLVRFCIGVLYGYMVRFLGVMWFYLGALYGLLYVYVIRFLGLLRFCLGLLSFCVGTLYGYVVRVLGFIWYYLGALYGLLYVYVIRFLGLLRFCLGLLSFCVGTLYGYVVRVLGFIWYYLGALYGLLYVYVIRFLGLLRFCLGLLSFYVGTLYGYVVRALGFIWFYVGVSYGMFVRFYHYTPFAKIWYFGKYQFHKRVISLLRKNKKTGGGGGGKVVFCTFYFLYFLMLVLQFHIRVLFRLLGSLWYYLGALYGYMVRLLGFVWYYLGALYGLLYVYVIRFLGLLRFCLGTLYGYMVRLLGFVWYYLGALYGLLHVYVVRVLGFIWFYVGVSYGMFVRFYHYTPFAKIWYFGKYQFHKRVKSLFKGNKKKQS